MCLYRSSFSCGQGDTLDSTLFTICCCEMSSVRALSVACAASLLGVSCAFVFPRSLSSVAALSVLGAPASVLPKTQVDVAWGSYSRQAKRRAAALRGGGGDSLPGALGSRSDVVMTGGDDLYIAGAGYLG